MHDYKQTQTGFRKRTDKLYPKKKFKSDKAIASFSIWLFVLMGVYAISIRRLTCAERVSEAEEESGERLISCILSKA